MSFAEHFLFGQITAANRRLNQKVDNLQAEIERKDKMIESYRDLADSLRKKLAEVKDNKYNQSDVELEAIKHVLKARDKQLAELLTQPNATKAQNEEYRILQKRLEKITDIARGYTVT